MATFSSFVFENRSGLDLDVELQAPIGTRVSVYRINAGMTGSSNPNINNVTSVKFIATDIGMSHSDSEEVTLTGSRQYAFVKSFKVHYQTVSSFSGSIEGEF